MAQTTAGKMQSLPKDMDKKLKSVLSELNTSSGKVRSNLKHVVPVVQTLMPEKLQNSLCPKFREFPVTYDYKCPRFDVDDPAGYKHLEDHGYAVFKNVVPNQEEIEAVKSEMWDWMESLPFPNGEPIDRNDPETWHDGHWPTDPRTGIIFSYGVGQAHFMWRCRSYPGVKKVFGTAWGTDDLITSFDGCNMYRPWKYNAKWKTKGKWWHLDQNARNPRSKGKQSIQGLLALMDGNEKTGGLCVIPGTHEKHTEICNRMRYPKTMEYIPIPKNDRLFEDYKETGGYLVHYKAGDLVLWDSRTVHCNAPSIEPTLNPETGRPWVSEKEKAQKKWEMIRMVAYICMGPREKASNEVLQKRHDIAFQKRTTSTHWPQYFSYRLGPEGVGKQFELNEKQKELVGYPRGWLEEMAWQAKYEFELGIGDLFMASAAIGALGFAARTFYNKR